MFRSQHLKLYGSIRYAAQQKKQQRKDIEANIVDIVCKLAKEKNEQKLNAMVEEGYCLSAFAGRHNAVKRLAKDGDTAAVDFLISKFNASRNHAVEGYALGGHVEQVNEQIKKGASRDCAISGYAIAGNEEQVNRQIKMGANIDLAAHGYAKKGDVKLVNRLLEKGADKNWAALGYAFGGYVEEGNRLIAPGEQKQLMFIYATVGNVEQVNLLIAQGVDSQFAVIGYAFAGNIREINKLPHNVVDMVLGYAMAGNARVVNQLIAAADEKLKQGLKNCAVQGYAGRGHVAQVNYWLAKGVSLNVAVEKYISSDHINEANHLIERGANKDFAVRWYAYNRLVDQVNQLIAQGASRTFAAEGYARGGYQDLAEDQIVHGADRTHVMRQYATAGKVELVNALIAQGADRNIAILNYAASGYIDEVNKLIAQGGSRNYAAKGYACNPKCISYMNEQITKGAHLNRALAGVCKSNWFHTLSDSSDILVQIDNDELRKLIINKYTDDSTIRDKLQLFYKKWNNITGKYNLSLPVAASLQVTGARAWFLQGHQLVNQAFPYEIFFHISTYIVGLSLDDTKKVFSAINKQLFEDLNHDHLEKYLVGELSQEQYENENERDYSKYVERKLGKLGY